MATRTLIAALLSSALAAACAATNNPFADIAHDEALVKAAQDAPACSANGNLVSCSITVNVFDDGDGCQLEMASATTQETIAFPRKAFNLLVFWRLDDQTTSKTFIFTEDGIAIDGNAKHVFDKAERIAGGKILKWRNRNPLRPQGAGSQEFYYSVHVTNSAGNVECSMDPHIRNDS